MGLLKSEGTTEAKIPFALRTVHIFSSNYEKDNFDELAEVISELGRRNYCTVVTVDENGIKYQTIKITTKRNLAIIRSGLKTLAVGHAVLS